MDGTIWLLVWTLALGLITGCRYGRYQASSGLASALGYAVAQPKQALRRKEIDPVCDETVSMDHARPCVHEGRVYYLCSRERREILKAAPALYIDASGASDPSRPRGRSHRIWCQGVNTPHRSGQLRLRPTGK